MTWTRKLFFVNKTCLKLLLHAKKSPKSAFRVYIYAKNEFFDDFFGGFTFPIPTYPTPFFHSDASRPWMSAQEK